MKVKNIKLLLAFRGKNFYGWQTQTGRISVQETLEKALSRIISPGISVTGCGRTDRGVNALGYVANFMAETGLEPSEIREALNFYLPADIRVRKACPAPCDFHSRYDAVSKVYRYLVSFEKSPFLRDASLYLKSGLELGPMMEAAAFLEGRRDFASFCASGSNVKSTVREMHRIEIGRKRFTLDGRIILTYIDMEADGFLYRMARNIAGTLIQVGLNRLEPADVEAIMLSGDRRTAPATAPAHALYLKKVNYR